MPRGLVAGGEVGVVSVATSCSVQTQQLMASGKGNLAVTVASSVFAFASFNGCTAHVLCL
jgi:hypothetical protein